MAQLATRRQYAAGSPLLKNDLDAFIDDIETFVNVIRLNNDNIQDLGITASTKINDGTLTGDTLNNLAVTTAKIADSNITTAKFNDEAVTTAKIPDNAITTAKIASTTISTANIADAAVTGSKIETALKTVTSWNIASASIASNTSTYAAVGSLGTITTQGGPLLIQGGNGQFESIAAIDVVGFVNIDMYIERSVSGAGVYSTIAIFSFARHLTASTVLSALSWKIPVNIIKHIDTPSAGTWDYRLMLRFYRQSSLGGGTIDTFTNPITTSASAALLLKELI